MPMQRRSLPLLLLFCAAAGACNDPQGGAANEPDGDGTVAFEWFQYAGNDEIFTEPLAGSEYQNPIVAGFFPDPSITRRGEDYYMVHSSFSYAPGVPILHSRNLVDWRLIGHALTRPGQLDLRNQPVSRGVFAPTIRYHDGLFYVITTVVDTGGNFYVTAEDPAGPWSDPYWLPEIDGIDPDGGRFFWPREPTTGLSITWEGKLSCYRCVGRTVGRRFWTTASRFRTGDSTRTRAASFRTPSRLQATSPGVTSSTTTH